ARKDFSVVSDPPERCHLPHGRAEPESAPEPEHRSASQYELCRVQVRVAPQGTPVPMPGELGNFMDLVSSLEQPADAFMAQVVEVKVIDAEGIASPREVALDGCWAVGKDAFVPLRLAIDDRQRFARELDGDVVALTAARAFHVPDKDSHGSG